MTISFTSVLSVPSVITFRSVAYTPAVAADKRPVITMRSVKVIK